MCAVRAVHAVRAVRAVHWRVSGHAYADQRVGACACLLASTEHAASINWPPLTLPCGRSLPSNPPPPSHSLSASSPASRFDARVRTFLLWCGSISKICGLHVPCDTRAMQGGKPRCMHWPRKSCCDSCKCLNVMLCAAYPHGDGVQAALPPGGRRAGRVIGPGHALVTPARGAQEVL